jgi:hypothetical protein
VKGTISSMAPFAALRVTRVSEPAAPRLATLQPAGSARARGA